MSFTKRPWRVERYRDDGTWKVDSTWSTEAKAEARHSVVVVELIAASGAASAAGLARVRKHVEFEATTDHEEHQ